MQVFRFLLFPFALIFICVTELRLLLFSLGILKRKQFNLPIIVVGNLSSGGTGKSPMIDYLLKLLNDFRPASLSRGYGRKSKGFLQVNNLSTSQMVGDEPLMLKKLNPQVEINVDENRVRGIETILSNSPLTNVILLDDAFQHRYVKPGLAILLTTFENPFFNDFVIPIGNLRELRKNAKEAKIIVVTKCPQLTETQKQEYVSKINKYSNAKVFFAGIKYGAPIALFDTKIQLNNNCDVLLVSGIANADSLLNHCKSAFDSVTQMAFSDHHSYNTAEFNSIAKNFNSFASEKKIVLTTHKDAVKWLEADEISIEILKKLPIYFQPIQMEVIDNQMEFNELILNYVRSTKPNC